MKKWSLFFGCLAVATLLVAMGGLFAPGSTDDTTAPRAAMRREFSWGEGGPAFTVLGFEKKPMDMPGRERGRPAIMLACRWREAPAPWDRYRLSFPDAHFRYADGVSVFPLISPLTKTGFVIHYFFPAEPAAGATFSLRVECRDAQTGRVWGLREASFPYLPDDGASRLALMEAEPGR